MVPPSPGREEYVYLIIFLKSRSCRHQSAVVCIMRVYQLPLALCLHCNPYRSPERAQEPKAPPKIGSPREEEEAPAAAAVAEGEEEEEEDEEALMVPQVKVAEDGSLIIDEERSVDMIETD